MNRDKGGVKFTYFVIPPQCIPLPSSLFVIAMTIRRKGKGGVKGSAGLGGEEERKPRLSEVR